MPVKYSELWYRRDTMIKPPPGKLLFGVNDLAERQRFEKIFGKAPVTLKGDDVAQLFVLVALEVDGGRRPFKQLFDFMQTYGDVFVYELER